MIVSRSARGRPSMVPLAFTRSRFDGRAGSSGRSIFREHPGDGGLKSAVWSVRPTFAKLTVRADVSAQLTVRGRGAAGGLQWVLVGQRSLISPPVQRPPVQVPLSAQLGSVAGEGLRTVGVCQLMRTSPTPLPGSPTSRFGRTHTSLASMPLHPQAA